MNNDYASIFSGILRENQIKTNEPMKRHTTFGIGGPADCFLMPETTEEVCLITKLAHKHAVPLFVLGGGANLLVRDKGIRGAVVFTGRLHRMERKENLLTVASGVPTAAAARKALEYGLSHGICQRHSRQYWRSCLYECGGLWRRNGEDHRFCHHL